MRCKKVTYAALVLLTLGFTACSQDEDFALQEQEVRISATIANLATRVAYDVSGETNFVSSDQILVVNIHSAVTAEESENRAVFAYDGTDWTAASGKLLWKEKTTNAFQAYYPATLDYTLPTDQSTLDKLTAADRMEAQATADFNTEVPFEFNHVMAKVSFVTYLNSEFDSTIDKITAMKVVTLDGIEVSPYVEYNEDSDDVYTAIISPYWYTSTDETFVKVYMNDDIEPLTVKIPAKFVGEESGGFQPGTHYTFTLTVGKEKVTIEQISTNGIGNPFSGGWDNDSETDLN